MLIWVQNLKGRFDWRFLPVSACCVLLFALVYPLMRWANPVWFAEDSVVENCQLLVLLLAFGVAVTAQYEKKMFWLAAFVVLFLMVREVNGGRAYFCKLYLPEDEVCRWKNMKYGYLADWIRYGAGVLVVLLALYHKLWQPIGKYVCKAPIYVWDIVLFAVAAVGAQMAECSWIDNEIMEESLETLMYLMLARLLWRYSRTEVK